MGFLWVHRVQKRHDDEGHRQDERVHAEYASPFPYVTGPWVPGTLHPNCSFRNHLVCLVLLGKVERSKVIAENTGMSLGDHWGHMPCHDGW